MTSWQFFVDRGGTFTDIIAYRPDGVVLIHKVLSDNPANYQDAVVYGIETIRQSQPSFESSPISAIKMGTTVATNALLTHQGAKVGLLITKGFSDLLEIGSQKRRHLFALNVRREKPLYVDVVEVSERIDAKGHEREPLATTNLEKDLERWLDEGVTAVAVVLLHSDKNPRHEKKLLEFLAKYPFQYVSASHMVSETENVVMRGQTTLVDAYLSPILIQYIALLREHFKDTPIYFMQSNGGLIDSDDFFGRNSILSGPAGGMVGAINIARELGCNKVIGFDMGGTSTDVFHYKEAFEYSFETEIASVALNTPMLDIHTIAAGGGSILHYTDKRMQVGPQSAGSSPGPLSYLNGGPLTITDANFLLGKLSPQFFPKCFGKSQDKSPDATIVQKAFDKLTNTINRESKQSLSVHEVAEGFIDIAVCAMAQAIQTITFSRGHNIEDYMLQSFGGASGQHACLVAEKLGIKRLMLHPLASLLSAYGMGVAKLTKNYRKTINKPLDEKTLGFVISLTKKIKPQLKTRLGEYLGFKDELSYHTSLELRARGSNTSIECPLLDDWERIAIIFKEKYQALFGFCDNDMVIDVYTLVIEGSKPSDFSELTLDNHNTLKIKGKEQRFYSKGAFHTARCYDGTRLSQGQSIDGPALIIYPHTSFVLEPNWQVSVGDNGVIIADQIKKDGRYFGVTDNHPILLEIFNKSFMHIATQMGYVLKSTAISVNIKERQDYSCAIFDSEGGLVANAPHMPVHLGSMGESVKQIIKLFSGEMQQGDSYVLNDPYQGGTHLPDITVVSPVFINESLAFFVGSRGHHADVGGISPGSLPAFSETIHDEGVLIRPQRLVKDGKFLTDEMKALFSEGGARNVQQNILDLKAQCAANLRGINGILELIDAYSLATVNAYTQYIQDNAASAAYEVIKNIREGKCRYLLDDGGKICVAIKKERDNILIDFSGTSKSMTNNFNAPLSVTRAAVLYVIRSLVKHDIPLNEGCLRHVKLLVPQGSLINPDYPFAVVAGNVETSQAIVNALYLALGVMASAQGTMNNLTFGNEHYQYYETLCGGTGAGRAFHGCDAIHSHMTNSLLTDIEVLESRYPIEVMQFKKRIDSGGVGQYRGGSGVIRELKFLEPMDVNMISGHRTIAPPGLAGGGNGVVGQNLLIRENGMKEQLPGCFHIQVKRGDRLLILTPGGGGYGHLKK